LPPRRCRRGGRRRARDDDLGTARRGQEAGAPRRRPHGEHLLRVKGLLRVEDEAGPIVVQAVQHVVYPTYSMPSWPSDDRSSHLMVITRGMPASLVEELRASLTALLHTTAKPSPTRSSYAAAGSSDT
ncbi:MAG: GTP-binding protein, partial [Polyangiaceae bacterium]|nr:GTP-binding protein [Polyangiaceae bacterium]